MEECFRAASSALTGYMTDTAKVDCTAEWRMHVKGRDMCSLLFAFLDDILFQFTANFFVTRDVIFESFDAEGFEIKARCIGERYDRHKHTPGTEIKAITYSNMIVSGGPGLCEIFVIVDI